MKEKLIDEIKELEIKSTPAKQTLEAANECYTKKQLAYFIERHDMPIAKSWLKDEIVTALSEWMNDTQKDVLSNHSELLAYYEKDILGTDKQTDLYEDDLSEDELEKLHSLMAHGLVYNVDGKFWVPEEAAETTEEVEADDNESKKETASDENKEQSDKESKKASGTQNKQQVKSVSSTLSPEERIERNKKARLNYFKSKKKKRKKRK